jgi:hypothetical protein
MLLVLLSAPALAIDPVALDCEHLLLSVEVGEHGFHVRGADELLYPQGRPPRADNSLLRCGDGSCTEVEDFNWSGLQETLGQVGQACPGTRGITLVPEAEVRHDVLLELMDQVEDRWPGLIVGGGAQGYGGSGTPSQPHVLLRPGRVMIDGRDLRVEPTGAVIDTLLAAFGEGGQPTTTLRIEAADGLSFALLRDVMHTAGKAGYTRFEHVSTKGGAVHSSGHPGGGEWTVTKEQVGHLDKAQITAGIQGVAGGVLACYNEALGRDGGLAGTVKTRITIGADGDVLGVVLESGLGEDAADACIVQAVEQARFDAPGGVLVTTFPFDLNPG